jgi:HlyD family secretion protein
MGGLDMDIPRPSKPRRVRTRVLLIALVAAVVIVATVAIAQLRPAGAPVNRSSVMTATVVRGTLVRSVRGPGRLVPEQFRWVAAITDGRIDKILVQPGTRVTADTVVLELSDPTQSQEAVDAEWQLRAAEADYETLKAALAQERLSQEAAYAELRGNFENARLRADSDAQMAKEGIVADLTRKVSATNAEQLQRRLTIEERRLSVGRASLESRLAAQRAEVEQRRALYRLRRGQVDALRVRAGIEGVLQEVRVEAGQRVTAGTTLARIVQPERLKAEIRIGESEARDVHTGNLAAISTPNGIVSGVVSRVDPAAREGSVTVDLRTTSPLPAGSRPDLSVEATIELGRLTDVLSVTRPVGAREHATGTVFKLVEGGRAAERVAVAFGVTSSESIQITKGLRAGDEIVISDAAAWDKDRRIEFK